MNRRKFLKAGMKLGIGSSMLGLYAWQIEPRWVEFTHTNMEFNHPSIQLNNQSIMQISDLHIDDETDINFIIKYLRKAKRYEPDYVVYTGDYITYHKKFDLAWLDKVLKESVKGTKGTFAILGNHDYGVGYEDDELANSICRILTQNDMHVLRNESQTINDFNFIGIDEMWSPHFRPRRALAKYKEDKLNIVLCHNPDVVDLSIWNNYKGWILSGHTHGGQCKPPLFPPPILPVRNKRLAAGRYDLADNRKLYINRALGNHYHLRFNVRPEISIFHAYTT